MTFVPVLLLVFSVPIRATLVANEWRTNNGERHSSITFAVTSGGCPTSAIPMLSVYSVTADGALTGSSPGRFLTRNTLAHELEEQHRGFGYVQVPLVVGEQGEVPLRAVLSAIRLVFESVSDADLVMAPIRLSITFETTRELPSDYTGPAPCN